MNKILAALTIVAMLAITSSAVAKGAKPPKLMCLDMDSYPDRHQLSFKSIGTIMNAGSKVKTYTITGRDHYGIISGSGYVMPGTTELRATYSGLSTDDVINNYRLVYDLSSGTGTVYMRFDTAVNTLEFYNSDVTEIECDTLMLPPSAGDVKSSPFAAKSQ